MRQAITKFLRGDYNSVRYRFLILPRQWLHYFFAYRLFGKDWTEFYADRMNDEVAKGGGISIFSANTACNRITACSIMAAAYCARVAMRSPI